MSSSYVKCNSEITVGHEGHGQLALRAGDVLRADHWAVADAPEGQFEPVDLAPEQAEKVDKAAEVRSEAETLAQRRDPGQRQRAENLHRQSAKLYGEVRDAVGGRAWADEVRAGVASGKYKVESGTSSAPRRADDGHIGAVYGSQRGRNRSVAMRSIDESAKAGVLPDHAAARAEALVTSGPVGTTDVASRWVEVTGSPAYRGAFSKLCADPERGHLLWDGAELDAFRVAQAFATQYRAMSTSPGSAGGFMVPYQLDPSITLTSDGSVSPLRRLARVVQTITNEWHGVASAGVTAEWKSEGAEAADASPTLAGPKIPVHMGDAFVPFSYEIGEDQSAFLTELQGLLVDAADQLQAEAFVNGSGSGQPKGIVTALTSTASEVSADTAGSVSAADVVGVQNGLGPRFQPAAQWAAPLDVINTLGALETGNGARRFPEVGAGSLLRKPLNEASQIAGPDGSGGAALVYGDFATGYTIVDRIGTTMELIPNLFGSNRRPTGQRGALMRFRTGADAVAVNAFRMLTS